MVAKSALNRVVVLYMVIAWTFSSCDSPATFVTPQPELDKNESHFNWRYRGSYMSNNDSSLLIIDKHHIRQEWSIILESTKSEIDSASDWHIKDGALYIKDNPEPFVMSMNGDSVRVMLDWVDTLFSISPSNVLRKWRGYYFLNFMHGPQSWGVEVLKLDRHGALNLLEMRNNSEIEKIEPITDVEKELGQDGEVVNVRLRPSKRQLKDLIQNGGFVRGRSFQKIN